MMQLNNIVSQAKRASVEHLLALSPYEEYNKIISRIKPYSIISFDIFDTIIKRDVDCPQRVFDLVELAFHKGNLVNSGSFRNMRIQAEREARKQSSAEREEVTLEEIYRYIPLDETTAAQLMQLEIDLELTLSCPSEPMRRIVRWALGEGKRVILVSDMYLPEVVVQRILEKNGYGNLPLYLSSTLGVMKKTGRLFNKVIESEDASPEEIIHLGDNVRSDYIRARQAGLASILVRRRPCVTHHPILPSSRERQAEITAGVLNSIADNHAAHLDNYYERFGWDVFGPLLFKIANYIYQVSVQNGIHKIYFLARDGYVVKKAFDILYGDDKAIESRYLYSSRRSFGVPSIRNYDDFLALLPGNKVATFSELLEAVGLPKEFVPEGAHPSDEVRLFRAKDPGRFELYLKWLYDQTVAVTDRELNAIRSYFNQEAVFGNVLLFDIGWAGSIQCYFNRLIDKLGIEAKSIGVYVGCLPTRMRQGIEYRSLLGYKPEGYFGLLESFFLAPEGSCRSFSLMDDGLACYQLYPYEYDSNGIIDEAEVISNIQRAALAFVGRFKEIVSRASIELPAETAMSRMESIGTAPRAEDICKLGDIRYVTNGDVDYLARPDSLLSYLLHPGKMKRDFSNSRWKIGFIKRLIKIPLPYGWIYNQATRLRDRQGTEANLHHECDQPL